jgi:addiction module RelB/DinJ family antitoxin
MKTMINIKADKEVKESAQEIARELGLPLSGVINAFLKEFIRTRSISFSAVPTMTPALERIIAEVEVGIKTGKIMSPALSDPKEIGDYLDSL